MSTQFSLDLRLARRKAGFTQRDLAHLLAAQQGRVSELERGRRLPTLEQIVTLSLIYGRSFESLFSQVMDDARVKLCGRVPHMPADVRRCAATFNREASIERLARRLRDDEIAYESA